jgi:hypothetical protein
MQLVAGVDGILFSEAFAVEGVVVFARLLLEREKPQLVEDREPEFRRDVTARMIHRRPIDSAGGERPIKATEANRAMSDERRAGRLRGSTGGCSGSRAPRARGHSSRERGVRCR